MTELGSGNGIMPVKSAGCPPVCCGATRMLRLFCAAAKEISPDVNKGIVG
jgi:hypothetical protein